MKSENERRKLENKRKQHWIVFSIFGGQSARNKREIFSVPRVICVNACCIQPKNKTQVYKKIKTNNNNDDEEEEYTKQTK